MTLYVSDQLECMKLWLGNDEIAESLWVKIKGRALKGDVIVGHLIRRMMWMKPLTERQ